MHLIDKIEMDYAPRRKLCKRFDEMFANIEMSEDQSAFLCGLLRQKKPSKVLEVGTSAGGTTAVVLQCLEEIGVKYKMYSVDYSASWYRDKNKKTGFLVNYLQNDLNIGLFELLLGNSGLPGYLETIGNGIDFVILDTAHTLPGEILDFLILLPNLEDGAIVCLHDIALNQWKKEYRSLEATNVLLHSVCANKILNFLPHDDVAGTFYPNIGAFQVTEATRENVIDVFLSLTLRWNYIPLKSELEQYSRLIRKLYASNDLYRIYDSAVEMNQKNLFSEILQRIPEGCRLILYGAGMLGRIYWEYLQSHCHIIQWLDREVDGKEVGLPISHPDDAVFEEFDLILIAIQSKNAAVSVKKYLRNRNVPDDLIVWGNVFS